MVEERANSDGYLELVSKSSRFEHLGVVETPNGGRCIGPPTEPGKYDFLFCLNPPLNEVELSELERAVHVPIPADLKLFYRNANRFSCFGNWFDLYGLRKLIRTGGMLALREQPAILIFENAIDQFAREHALLRISRYADGSPVYMHASGRIEVCTSAGRTKMVFPDLASWIGNEIDRFLTFVDSTGHGKIKFSEIPSPEALLD